MGYVVAHHEKRITKKKKKEFTALDTIAKEAKRDRGREKKGEKE